MNFTKQDILKIAAAITRLSKRDSEFPVTDRLNKDTLVPVLHSDSNQTVKMDKLLNYISSGVDISKTPVEGTQFEGKTTLLDVLYWLKARRGTGSAVSTEDVLVENNSLDYGDYHFGNLHGFLLNVLYHLKKFTNLDSNFTFCLATKTEINTITENTNS